MDLDFLKNITAVKKADPERVRKQHMRRRGFHLNLKTILCAFAVLIVILVCVSVITITSENKKTNSSAAETDVIDANGDPTELLQANFADSDVSMNGNILVAFTKSGTQGLHMLAVVNSNSDKGQVKLTYIPVTTKCVANNHRTTMTKHLEDGGITELLWAVSDTYNVKISRYIYCDEQRFCDIMKYVGDIPVKVDKTIRHKYNGIKFIIEEGTQNFTADMFLKYFVYLCDTYKQNTKKLTDLLSLFAKTLICFDEQKTPDVVYDRIVNYVETDISAMDISNYLPSLYSLVSSDSFGNIQQVSEISDLKEEE